MAGEGPHPERLFVCFTFPHGLVSHPSQIREVPLHSLAPPRTTLLFTPIRPYLSTRSEQGHERKQLFVMPCLRAEEALSCMIQRNK